ncbi:MAG TPA: hypothetical protein PLE16_09720 [Spirochaetota bacterium]|jgi:hypothetical protein|nr:hypothetical protein [Spirochaetota bacterium]
MLKKIILTIFACFPLFADDDVRIGYGIFANAGFANDHRSYLGADSYFLLLNTSTVWKPSINNKNYYDISTGIGFFNIIQIQHGWGSKSKFIKINSDLPLLNFSAGKPHLTYMYAREQAYRRINLNLNYAWYYKENEKVFSIGLGYLLL